MMMMTVERLVRRAAGQTMPTRCCCAMAFNATKLITVTASSHSSMLSPMVRGTALSVQLMLWRPAQNTAEDEEDEDEDEEDEEEE